MPINPHVSLTVQAQELVAALQDYGDWMKRSDLAKAIGKKSLNSGDLVLLQFLIEQQKIEVRTEETRAPSGQRYEYRVIT